MTPERLSVMRTRAPVLLAVATLISGVTIAGCGDGMRSSCTGPFLRIGAGGHSYDEGTCSGQYALQGPVTVRVGEAVTAETPKSFKVSSAWPLPVSADPRILRLESRTGDGRRERFRAVAPGRAMLDVWGFYCPYMPTPTPTPSGGRRTEAPVAPAVPRHRCPVLDVNVVPR
jgi:hypothetical protein